MWKIVYKQLIVDERSVVFDGLYQGVKFRALTRLRERPPSTISRKIRRNATRMKNQGPATPCFLKGTESTARFQNDFDKTVEILNDKLCRYREFQTPGEPFGRVLLNGDVLT